LTYPVVASTCVLAGACGDDSTELPNDGMSKIQCGQLHSELFGHRHSTLKSHGLFASAKHLLCILWAILLPSTKMI